MRAPGARGAVQFALEFVVFKPLDFSLQAGDKNSNFLADSGGGGWLSMSKREERPASVGDGEFRERIDDSLQCRPIHPLQRVLPHE